MSSEVKSELEMQNEQQFVKCAENTNMRDHITDVPTKTEIKEEPCYLNQNITETPASDNYGSSPVSSNERNTYSESNTVSTSVPYFVKVEEISLDDPKLEIEEQSSWPEETEFKRYEDHSSSDLDSEEFKEISASTSTAGNTLLPTESSRSCPEPQEHEDGAAQHIENDISNQEDKKTYKCDICDESFKRISHWEEHGLIHGNYKPYKCEICGKSFRRSPDLKQHQLIHSNIRSHKCDTCGKAFKRSSTLRKHTLIHNDNRPHKCDICDNSFKRLSSLRRHFLIHDDSRPHKCDICERSFKRLFDLRAHISLHGNNRPHKCNICDRSFKRLFDLRSHVLIHNDSRPHKCQICNKTFKRLSGLRSHTWIHDNNKYTMCEISING